MGSEKPTSDGRRLLFTVAVAVLTLCVSAGVTVFLRGGLRRTPAAKPADALARGRLLYDVHCTSCHGPQGHGDGPAAIDCKPPPRDFEAGVWRFGTSAHAMRKVICDGVPGTAMPGAGATLSAGDVDALVTFVSTLVGPEAAPTPLAERTRALVRQTGFEPLSPPQLVPLVDLVDTAGRPLSLASLHGKVVVLNFWATNCSSCLAKLPELEKIAERLREKGIEVCCVCVDEQDAGVVHTAARQRVKSLPVYCDVSGLAVVRFDVQATPATFLIDPAGRIVGKAEGVFDLSAAALEALIEELQDRR